MKVVDEGRMLLNGQGQDHGSSGLNNVDIKVEAEVCEQSALDFVENVLLCLHHPFFFTFIAISHLLSSLESNPSH